MTGWEVLLVIVSAPATFVLGVYLGWSEGVERTERKRQADLAAMTERHASERRMQKAAEVDLANEKRRHGETTEDRDMFRERYYAEVKQHLARLSDTTTGADE